MEEGSRYSEANELSMFGLLVSSLEKGRSKDGDTGASFPRSDAEDLSCGARFIPGEVTLARREGKKVQFHTSCGRNCWYWEMPDGSRIYHYDPLTYDNIGAHNGKVKVKLQYGMGYPDGVGACPKCGNQHTNGGHFPKNKILPKLTVKQLTTGR
jgi:hypothetical protein